MDKMVVAAGLGDILEKVKNEERLSFDDGVRLYKANDLLALGYMADIVRRRKNGDNAYFISIFLLKVLSHGIVQAADVLTRV